MNQIEREKAKLENDLAFSFNNENILSEKNKELEQKINKLTKVISDLNTTPHYKATISPVRIINDLPKNRALISEEMKYYKSKLNNSKYFNKQDEIDRKLNEFIKSSQNSQLLAKLFIKESEGIYYFGSRKININIENENLISFII